LVEVAWVSLEASDERGGDMSEHLAGDDASEPTHPEPDQEEVRQRAWEISQRTEAGTPEENWQRAEQELRHEQGSTPGP
jgi:uncharacterized protein YegP (UPF0339 family)